MNYGLPYKGSKSKIANWVLSYLPPAETFVDLFCGGCAMTHAAMLSGKYKRFVCNDIIGDMPRLFADAIKGRYKNETRWISREDFFRLKDTDPYVRICWSFGNNGRDYLYSWRIEPYKKACHYAVVQDDWAQFGELCPEVREAAYNALHGVSDRKERRLRLGVAIVRKLKETGSVELIDSNPLYSSCHVKHDTKTRPRGTIRDLQSLESLQSLERYNLSYEQVPIPQGAIVYADIPYIGTNEYIDKRNEDSFDHQTFYEWVRTRDFPVWVSEYTMPDDFECIGAKQKVVCMSATATSNYIEKIFVYNRWADKIYKPTLFNFN